MGGGELPLHWTRAPDSRWAAGREPPAQPETPQDLKPGRDLRILGALIPGV